MSLQDADKESAAFAVAPRVALADIEGAINGRFDFTGAAAVNAIEAGHLGGLHPLNVLSICLLVMKNGFTVVGKSAPASADNFNAEYGRRLAYEDAIRQLWPLMGFALRDKLHVRSEFGTGGPAAPATKGL